MAKTDSFFIRATANAGHTAGFEEEPIDLGAYVDALGKSILRVWNVQVTYSDATGRSSTIAGNEVGVAQWQLTTQEMGNIVLDSNRSLISSGRVHMFNDQGTAKLASQVTEANGINLHEWTNGYLLAVESIYLGASASSGFEGNVYVSIVMECTVETMSQSAAMALSLSQQ